MGRLSNLALAVLVAGCASVLEPPERDEDRPLQTDRLTYEIRRENDELRAEIPFTYTNRTGNTVFVVNCQGYAPPVLEKLVDGEWQLAWAAVTMSCLSPPIVIEPGETYKETLVVYAAEPGTRKAPTFEVAEIEGIYRLVWHGLVHDYDQNRADFGEPLPLEERTSNSFVLRED